MSYFKSQPAELAANLSCPVELSPPPPRGYSTLPPANSRTPNFTYPYPPHEQIIPWS